MVWLCVSTGNMLYMPNKVPRQSPLLGLCDVNLPVLGQPVCQPAVAWLCALGPASQKASLA